MATVSSGDPTNRDLKEAVDKLAEAIDNLSIHVQKTPAETKALEKKVRSLTQAARKKIHKGLVVRTDKPIKRLDE